MKDLAGRTAVITGASRGIGVYVAKALAAQGMNLVLAARSAEGLEAVRAGLGGGAGVTTVPTDVSKRADCQALIDEATKQFGAVDVLVNNAGIETIYSYHKLSLDEIDEVIDINLRGTMHLTWMALPGMLERRRGHIVNMASLAGKAGPAFGEPYGATKAGMIGFTQSLRGSYQSEGVSASAICPGFVDTGMYAAAREERPNAPKPATGVATGEQVGAAVVKAIRQDLPEVIVNPMPVRPLLALYGIAPGITERLTHLVDSNKMFREQAEMREKQREGSEVRQA
ncbi:MAG TPA: SDR family oxidoreductase [Dehalococcoidia bacterium]